MTPCTVSPTKVTVVLILDAVKCGSDADSRCRLSNDATLAEPAFEVFGILGAEARSVMALGTGGDNGFAACM